MEEKRARSIRATDETFQRLKALCDEKAFDQGAALEALLNTWDVQQAKGLVPERAADVADFDAHLQGIQSAFLRSLELAKGAEQRARVAYATQLDAMAASITRLEKELEKTQARLNEAKNEADALREKLEESGRRRFQAEKRVKELEADAERTKRFEEAIDRLLGLEAEQKTKAETEAEAEAKAEAEAETEAKAEAEAEAEAKAEAEVEAKAEALQADITPAPNYDVFYVTKKGGEDNYRKLAVYATNAKEAVKTFHDIHKSTFQSTEGHAFNVTAEKIKYA